MIYEPEIICVFYVLMIAKLHHSELLHISFRLHIQCYVGDWKLAPEGLLVL